MDVAGVLPYAALALIAITAVLTGPIGPLDLPTDPTTCDSDIPLGTGNATITPASVPDEATLTESEFGAEVYRLDVPDASVNISGIQGRPLVVYKVHIASLGRTIGTSTMLSHCTTGQRNLSIDTATFEPDQITKPKYNATIKIVYRGSENGTKIAETLVTRNISVEVQQ